MYLARMLVVSWGSGAQKDKRDQRPTFHICEIKVSIQVELIIRETTTTSMSYKFLLWVKAYKSAIEKRPC